MDALWPNTQFVFESCQWDQVSRMTRRTNLSQLCELDVASCKQKRYAWFGFSPLT